MRNKKCLVLVIALLLLSFQIPACFKAKTAGKEDQTSLSEPQKPRGVYYDFDDILVPSELTLDKKNSLVYGSGQSRVGILIFSGRVEPSSAASFFQNSMQTDGWKLVSSFKYREYILTFLKPDRACMITISEKTFSTIVEVRTGPVEMMATQIKETKPR